MLLCVDKGLNFNVIKKKTHQHSPYCHLGVDLLCTLFFTILLLGSITFFNTLNMMEKWRCRKIQTVGTILPCSPSPRPCNPMAAHAFGIAFTTAVCKAVDGSHVNGKHLVPSEKFLINKTYKAQLCAFEVAPKHVILACEALDEEMSSIRTLAVITLNWLFPSQNKLARPPCGLTSERLLCPEILSRGREQQKTQTHCDKAHSPDMNTAMSFSLLSMNLSSREQWHKLNIH